MATNYYEELGLTKGASEGDIKKAFRKLAKENHPDKTNGDKAKEEKFKKINEAYQTLSNPEEKANYDAMLNSGFGGARGFNGFSQGGRSASFNQADFESIFGGATGAFGGNFADLFGSREPRMKKMGLSLTFEEAAFGCTKTVKIPDGIVSGGVKTNIKIPPGTDNESELIITVKGVSFIVVCQVSPSQEYQRNGLDLTRSIDIPLMTAILGGSVSFNHFGKELEVNVPAGTNSGAKLRLKGVGLSKDKQVGNLIVQLKLITPKNLTDKQKKLLEEFSKLENQKK